MEYGLSEKYIGRLKKDTILNLLIILMFYLVFNVLFQDHPQYRIIRILFIFLFAAVAAVVTVLNHKRVLRAQNTGYSIRKDALLWNNGRRTFTYPWHHFRKIVVNENRMSLPYPYEFHTKEGMFTIHRQLEKPEILITKIIKEASPYAEIDEKIPDVIKADDNWVKGLGRML